MIKDTKLRDKLFAQFPALTIDELQNVQDNYFEHYALYKRIKRGLRDVYECHCTRCKHNYTIKIEPMEHLKHKSKGMCPKCGKPVTFLAKGRGRQYIWENKIFAIFRKVSDNLFISCYDIYKKFEHDAYVDLDFSWAETHRYCLTPHDGAQHWKGDYCFSHDMNHWIKEWRPLKSERASWGYELINKDVVKETFLKYADKEQPEEYKDLFLGKITKLAESLKDSVSKE